MRGVHVAVAHLSAACFPLLARCLACFASYASAAALRSARSAVSRANASESDCRLQFAAVSSWPRCCLGASASIASGAAMNSSARANQLRDVASLAIRGIGQVGDRQSARGDRKHVQEA